ncbi:MAG: isopentenyl-diphosphate Delta-isomerase [Pedobacter sp.]|jgi:isopentenyl-diphosphate delta-isomerase|nr:MAG: isopentenyl-diphosphate Delta-isomerase [Pedobacter sp.]
MINRNKVVLVDEKDTVLAEMDKLKAHQQGLLHRAFSVFIFNKKEQLLLQQRAQEKYHGGGLWTNTCCSHPQWGDNVKESAEERLHMEMGLDCTLIYSHAFMYKVAVENNLIEHEYDHVFYGFSDQKPILNKAEVQAYKWLSIEEINQELLTHPEQYTYWFKLAFPKVIKDLKASGKI